MARTYMDKRGWKYRVMAGLGENTYKARYQKADKRGSSGWKCCPSLDWRDSFEAAQADLDKYAERKGMMEVTPDE